jgi:hypothetical protein
MLLHIARGDAVRHALIAEAIDQPIENDRGVVPANRGDDAVLCQAYTAVVDEVWRASNAADAADQPDRPAQVQRLGHRNPWLPYHLCQQCS